MCLLIWILRLNALTEFRTLIADNLANLDSLGEQLPAPVLFYHNARTTVVFLLLGLVSFGTLGLTLFIGNIALVGGVLGGGAAGWLFALAGICRRDFASWDF